jgi:hypothetical protein
MKIASERWNIIQAAAAMLTSTSEATAAADAATAQGKTDGYRRRIFVPFDDGLDPRPLEVYLQNLFAVAQGVEIVYPLADPVVQEALLRSDFPKRWVDTGHKNLIVLRIVIVKLLALVRCQRAIVYVDTCAPDYTECS